MAQIKTITEATEIADGDYILTVRDGVIYKVLDSNAEKNIVKTDEGGDITESTEFSDSDYFLTVKNGTIKKVLKTNAGIAASEDESEDESGAPQFAIFPITYSSSTGYSIDSVYGIMGTIADGSIPVLKCANSANSNYYDYYYYSCYTSSGFVFVGGNGATHILTVSTSGDITVS